MIYAILIFLIGICVGSFINVLVLRTHKECKFLRGRSKCQKCQQVIAWYDLIPIVSFLVLRKRCRKCKEPISWQYLAVELATGPAFVLVYLTNIDALTGVFPTTDTLAPLHQGFGGQAKKNVRRKLLNDFVLPPNLNQLNLNKRLSVERPLLDSHKALINLYRHPFKKSLHRTPHILLCKS